MHRLLKILPLIRNILIESVMKGHVRIGMYLASFNIASDFFPSGSGFGSFGSLASISGGL